jgi:Sulfotransferase domain
MSPEPTADNPSRPRLFGIGLNKTGTSSLHRALEILGYRSFHHGGFETMALVWQAFMEEKPLLTYLDPELDAFSDIFGLTYLFFLADAQYPGSRFILTVRDLDEWLESRQQHVERNQERHAAGKYQDGFLKVDRDAWAAEYVQHEKVVRGYFADRPRDLLVFDLIGGDGWGPLCEFLGRSVPDEPFPRVNRSEPRPVKG